MFNENLTNYSCLLAENCTEFDMFKAYRKDFGKLDFFSFLIVTE